MVYWFISSHRRCRFIPARPRYLRPGHLVIRVLRFNRHRVRERNTPRNLLLLSDVASTIIISTMIRVHESSTLKFEREKDKYMYFEKQSYTKSGFYIFRISSLLLFKRALINKFNTWLEVSIWNCFRSSKPFTFWTIITLDRVFVEHLWKIRIAWWKCKASGRKYRFLCPFVIPFFRDSAFQFARTSDPTIR